MHNKTLYLKTFSVSAVALAAVLATVPEMALAQAPAPTPDTVYGGIEDIVVTARKRDESVQDIPMAVTALSEKEIARYDLSSLERVAASTPSFTITRASNGSGAQLSIRGIGTTVTSIGLEQSVATVVDGVYYGQGRIINEGLFDLARIEILKGPQSLFFGKNSTAGVISLTTADPTDELSLIAKAGYEFRAEQVIGEVVGSGPLSDTLGIRVALRGTKMFDGLYRNSAGTINWTLYDVATATTRSLSAAPAKNGPREGEILGRLTLKWQPTPEFTATLKTSYNNTSNNNASWNYVIFDCPEGLGGFTPYQTCGEKFRTTQNNMPVEFARENPLGKDDGKLFNEYESYGVTLNLGYDTDNLSISSVSNFNRNVNKFGIDADYFTSHGTNLWTTERARFRAFSTENRVLTTYDGPVNFLAGMYYQRTNLDLYQFAGGLAGLENSAAPAGYRYTSFSKESGTKGETVAAFGQVIWNPLDVLEFTAGVRYTHETKKSHFNQFYINPGLLGVFVENSPFQTNQKFKNWSPEFTAAWKVTDDQTLYGAYRTGYKSGGFSNTGILSTAGSPADFDFEPEKARGFEFGYKGIVFDRQLRFDISAYNFKFTNLQVDFFNSTTVSFVTTNAGSARSKGIDLSLEYAPRDIEGLSLRGTANYNRSRYKDYLAPCVGGQTPAEGCNLVIGGVPFQDISGKPTAQAPDWTASFGASYDFDLSDDLIMTLSSDARYSSSYIANPFANMTSLQKKYISLDGAVRVRTADDRWEFAVIGRNLTNRFILMGTHDVVDTGSGTGTPGGIRAMQVGQFANPRTVQAQITFRY